MPLRLYCQTLSKTVQNGRTIYAITLTNTDGEGKIIDPNLPQGSFNFSQTDAAPEYDAGDLVEGDFRRVGSAATGTATPSPTPAPTPGAPLPTTAAPVPKK